MSVFTAPEQMCQPKSMNFVRKMYVGTRIPSVEPHGLARGFSQSRRCIVESRKKRKEKIEKFFENMSEEELDDLLERNGINDSESEEAACFRQIKN